MSPSHQAKIYNVIIIGARGVGKTALVRNLAGKNFDFRYVATHNTTINQVTFSNVKFNILDCPGQKNNLHFAQTDAVIAMFDLDSKLSYRNLLKWIEFLQSVCDKDIPVIVCGNKCDILNHKVKADEVSTKYVNISTKTGKNCEKPFLILANHFRFKMII
uniref:Ras family GTPase n=1 Tax=Marseillevirus LCMAC102 TaxID=2506603 RepID=A0A481YTG1_9VIRU|nr:MAG: Ras family GTPase [Marseillevirus LCMAC102]